MREKAGLVITPHRTVCAADSADIDKIVLATTAPITTVTHNIKTCKSSFQVIPIVHAGSEITRDSPVFGVVPKPQHPGL